MMRRREFLKGAALGLAGAASAVALGGCTTLARSAHLEDKRHYEREDNAAAVAGEPVLELSFVVSSAFAFAFDELADVYTGYHPNIAFSDPVVLDATQVVDAIDAGAFDGTLFDLPTISQTIQARGYTVADQVYSVFGARLVAVAAQGCDLDLQAVADLADPSVSAVFVADPSTAYSGRFANQALFKAGLYTDQNGTDGSYASDIASRVAVRASAEAVCAAVAADEAAVGLVLAPEAFQSADVRTAFEVPRQDYRTVRFFASDLSTGAQSIAAADFVRWCNQDTEASRVVAPYGFVNDYT